jgi:hypothetical protein
VRLNPDGIEALSTVRHNMISSGTSEIIIVYFAISSNTTKRPPINPIIEHVLDIYDNYSLL